MTPHQLSLVSIYQSTLMDEFINEEYGNDRFFFPDNISERQAKFMIWLMKKYGVEEKFLHDAEQFELLALLKQK